MIELFDTISSYLNKFVTFFETLFNNIKDAINELKTWIDYLPLELIAGASIIVVLLVIFRILGR